MSFQEKTKKKIAIAAVLLVLLVFGLLWRYIGTPLLHFISNPAEFRDWVNQHGAFSRLAYIGMVVFQIIVAVIPGEPFEIAAGYAFGAWEGTALCIFAAALGSLLTFWMVRIFGLKLVKLFFSEEQIASVRFLKSTRRRDLLFLIVYMIPGTPKDLLGYFAGLTDIRLPVWAMICTFGRIPSIVTSTVGGDALGTQNYLTAAIVFAVTLAISGLGLVAYDRIRKKQEGASQ